MVTYMEFLTRKQSFPRLIVNTGNCTLHSPSS